MKTIPLTRGLTTIVSDVDYPRLSKHRWYAQKRPNGLFHAARRIKVTGRMVYMHSEILSEQAGFVVDHKDGNGLNNQRGNLRYATKAQNAQNSRKRTGTISKYKGVGKNSRSSQRSWRAFIQDPANRTYKHLGTFASEVDAASAYDTAAIRLFGTFARLNFPSQEAA